MSREFQIIQLSIKADLLKNLSNRMRNQLVGCMHAHNELGVMNRLLMFSLNDVGEGELHDDAHGVQMWTIMQVLTGKLFETWNMLEKRFLKSIPEDQAIARLSDQHKESLTWLKDYFGVDSRKATALRIIRDKTAFHYDTLNLDQAVDNVTEKENRVYLAQHPANTCYYLGSALIFRAAFAAIADQKTGASTTAQSERMAAGAHIALSDVNEANLHLHNVLYGLIVILLEQAIGKPLRDIEQLRIPVTGAPKPTFVALPMFVDVS